jgi:hypothetical protein
MPARSVPDPDADTGGAVGQVAVPAEARALSTLPEIDYEDAFAVDVGPLHRRTAEQWARTMLELAPADTRRSLLTGWSAIGLKVDCRRSGQHVLGWQIRGSTPDYVLLGAGSRIGLPGELLFQRQADRLLFCTFVQQANPIARTVWAAIEVTHVKTVRRLLEEGGRRCRQ